MTLSELSLDLGVKSPQKLSFLSFPLLFKTALPTEIYELKKMKGRKIARVLRPLNVFIAWLNVSV